MAISTRHTKVVHRMPGSDYKQAVTKTAWGITMKQRTQGEQGPQDLILTTSNSTVSRGTPLILHSKACFQVTERDDADVKKSYEAFCVSRWSCTASDKLPLTSHLSIGSADYVREKKTRSDLSSEVSSCIVGNAGGRVWQERRMHAIKKEDITSCPGRVLVWCSSTFWSCWCPSMPRQCLMWRASISGSRAVVQEPDFRSLITIPISLEDMLRLQRHK